MKSAYLNDEFFSRLETLALNLRADLNGYFGGKHFVRSYGQTVEFADYREYQLGDDIRRIDWNLFSRFEKYFIRLFTDERQMDVQIFLDCSASMGKENRTKAEYAVSVAAALGFLSVHNMDKVSFKLIKEDAVEDPFGTIIGKNSFFRAISLLENLNFSDDADISQAVSSCANTGSNNGLSVIISDFLTRKDWKKAVDYLTYKKRQVLAIQLLSPEEEEPTYSGRVSLIDVESGDLADPRNMKLRITRSLQLAYQEALKDMKADIKSFCASRGADFISVTTDKPVERMLFGELLKAGIME
ncbi:MAG TPA: hypothetical protein DHG49_04805 [Clostridiales bacterium]|jgi:hypothetical protein|nr:DUF58 domain-containing protein [Subdoligranulum sp.]PWM86126.1 MAG: hypothetical protein DBY28_03945 [Subdoligranulum sp.]HCW82037.1 hypothetical protein [Clostridiales bacterium]